MMHELASILTILISGVVLARLLNVRGWVLPPLGFIVGLCLFIAIGTVQVVTPITTSPLLTLLILLGVTIVATLVAIKKDYDISIKPLHVLSTFVVVIILVWFFREVHLVNWHVDTFFYLSISELIANDSYEYVRQTSVVKRLLTVPLMHAPAHLGGELYLKSITPLLSISILLILVWFFREGCREVIRQKDLLVYFTVAGILLLLSINRYIWNSFYINGHLFFAGLVMLIAASGWLIAHKSKMSTRSLIALQSVVTPALIVTRPEAFLVAGLALLPTLLNKNVVWKYRAVLLFVLGFSMAAWYGFVAYLFMSSDTEIGLSVYGPLTLGFLCLLAIPLLKWGFLLKQSIHRLLWLVESGLWLALLTAIVLNPVPMVDSIYATAQNVVFGVGSWGWSLVMISILLVAVLLLLKAPHQIYLRFPLTTFAPLAFLLIYMIGGGYRVGDGDSLNRMLIQIVPLMVLFIIVSASSGELRDWKTLMTKLLKRIKNLKALSLKLLR